MKQLTRLLGAASLAVLLAGCGGGGTDEPASTTQETPTAHALAAAAAAPVVYCPSGASYDAAVGFCTDGSNAYGPFTQAMTTACVNGGGGSPCTSTQTYNVGPATLQLQRWSLPFAKSIRGMGVCPKGAVTDSTVDGKCVETVSGVRNIYSSFLPDVVARCAELGGGNACYSTRWNASFYLKVSLQHRLQNNLTAAWNNTGLPTVSVALSTGDQGDVTATVGTYAGAPVNVATQQYRWASVTKNWTATLLMKLQEAGKLSIDAPLNSYITVPGLGYQSAMSLRELMNHSAGVGNYLDSSNSFLNSTNAWRTYSNGDIVGYINEVGPAFYPGNDYQYSNGGYYLLGMVIEKVLGVPIEQAFQDWMINPLALQNTLLDGSSSPTARLPRLVESPRAYAYSATSVRAAGALVSSPVDVTHYLRAVHKGGFITATSLATLKAPSAQNSNYGLGMIRFTDSATGIAYFGHTGTLLNYKSLVYYVPAWDVAVALTMNDYPSSATMDKISGAVFATLKQRYAP